MNQLAKVFEGQQMRLIEAGEETYFSLNDVCDILGLHSRAVKQRLEDDVCSTYPIQDALGRTQNATFVNEDGLYDVILDSRKQEAKKFRKWITSDVLPSIRKTGSYQLNVPKSFSESLRLAADLQEKLEQAQPKIEAHDRFLSGENYQKVGEVAKALGIGRNRLFRFMKERKIMMKDNTPYQQYIERGYFVVKEKPVKMGEQTNNVSQTYVTAKGVNYLDGLLNKAN